MTTYRITTHRADVVVSAQHGAGETLQNNTESPGCDVEVAGLKPDTIGIWNPATVVFHVDIGDEMFAASLIRIEAVGKAAEGGGRQWVPLCESTVEKPLLHSNKRSCTSSGMKSCEAATSMGDPGPMRRVRPAICHRRRDGNPSGVWTSKRRSLAFTDGQPSMMEFDSTRRNLGSAKRLGRPSGKNPS